MKNISIPSMGRFLLATLMLVAVPAEAAITYVGQYVTSPNASANFIRLNRPGGLTVGDLMLVQITWRSTATISTVPAGWALVTGGANPLDNGIPAAPIKQALYYKFAVSGEPANYQWNFTGTQRVAGGVIAYREVDAVTPIDAYGGQTNLSLTSITAPSITTTTNGAMVVGFFGLANRSIITSPTGMTARFSAQSNNALGVSVRAAELLQTTAAATGAKVATATIAGVNAGQLVALRSALLTEYRMDQAAWNGTAGEVQDNSGSGYHATADARTGIVPTTSQTTPALTGNPGTCRYGVLNGMTQYAAGPSGFPNLTGNFTITAWIRSNALTNVAANRNQRIFIDDENNTQGYGFSLNDAGNRRLRFYSRGITPANFDSNYNLNAGTWYFVAAVANTTTRRRAIYVYSTTGALLSARTEGANFAGTWGTDAGIPSIGGETKTATEGNLTGYHFNGSIDEVRVYRNALTSTRLGQIARERHTCPVNVDHFAITHGSTGVNCQAEPVTITVHDAAHAAINASGTTLAIATSTAHGDWQVQTGLGTLTPGAANSGSATYVFGSESSVVLRLKDTYAEAVNINLNVGGITESATEDPLLTFAPSGFRFIDAASVETIANQVAGVNSGNYYLQAIRTDTQTGACVGVFNNQTVNIQLASQCNNPTTCAGQQVSFNGTPIASNPNSGVASYANVPVSFLNDGTSRALFTFSYPDVGQISLHSRYNIPLGSGGASPNDMVGSSNSFVVKPFGFTVTGIQRTSDSFANPAAASAADPKFIHAGEPFTATVTAIAQGGAAAPNYGRETVPEGVLLTPGIVLPAAGANPALTNGTIAGGGFVNGVATPTTLSWDEVGIITLTPSVADGDYLGAGNVTGTVTGNVGRFVPHHFTALGEVTPACTSGAFTYMAQNFTLAKAGSSPLTGEMLEARNLGDTKTTNYTGAFALGVVSFGLENNDNGTDLSTRLTAPGSWSAGVYTLSSTNAVFSRPVSIAPDATWGAFDQLEIGITAADADVTTIPRVSGADMNPAAAGCGAGCTYKKITAAGGTKMRYGRLRLNNAHGSELLSLPVPVRIQYFNSTGFAANSLDTCTTISLTPAVDNSPTSYTHGDLLIDNPLKNMTVGASVPTLGSGVIDLSAPGAGNSGSVDLTLDVPAWLEFNWTGVAGDPKSRATFGAHRKADQFIYQRENY